MAKIIRLTENDLVSIIKKVLNEQTPDRKRFIKRDDDKLEQGVVGYSKQYQEFKSKGEDTQNNEKFMDLYRNAQSLVYQEKENGYVKKLLVGDAQISLWEKMKTDDMYFSADIIKKVMGRLKGRDRYKYCRLGTRTTFTELETLPKTKPGKDKPLPPEIDTVILPSTVVQQDFFENNSWRLKPAGENEFYQTFITPYKAALENLRQTYPNAGICVQSMFFEASASRFRNQGAAEDLSFEQLSEARARGVEDYLMNKYGELGAKWCTGERNTTINAKGQNGDGSSGPNPPKGYTFLPKGVTYNFNNFVLPSELDKTLESKRKQFGEPLPADRGGEKAYEQFRYVRPTVKIQLFYDEETPGAPIDVEPERTPPTKIIDPGQKYWAALYTWKFTFGGGGSGGSGKRKRINKHGSIKSKSCSDNTEADECARKSARDAKQHFQKKKRNQVNYN